jgi:nucleotide-binding universal stress UspA family protein
MYTSILVHLDDTPAGERRLGTAVATAQRFGAGLVAIYFVPAPPVEVHRAELAPPEISLRLSQGETRERVESMFRKRAKDAGVASVDFRLLPTDRIDVAIAEMRCVDLSILGQYDPDRDRAGFGRRLAEQAVMANGGPVLFLPYAPSTVAVGETVLVAWDGGRESARAARDALPLLRTAKRVVILSLLGYRFRTGDDAQRSQARLVAYLGAHGIEAESRDMPCTIDRHGELLLSQVADLGADLVVMGAYGHARVRELILGGVTRIMLDSMTVPALMSH